MQFTMTREWLQNKLAEMDAAGVDETACIVGLDVPATPGALSGPVVRAKMKCNTVQTTGSERHPNRNIQLGAVYSNDPESENRSFASATPSASVMLNIDPGRPAAHAFELGAEYYVDFTPCGVPTYRYIGDGIDALETRVMVCSRGGTVEVLAEYDGKTNKLTFTYGDFSFDASPYNNQALKDAGFTHWRYLREGE